jgi:hypothetical protein
METDLQALTWEDIRSIFLSKTTKRKTVARLGVVVHTYNSSTQEVEVGGS